MDKRLNRPGLAVIAALGVATSVPAMAATDGTFGQTSLGSVTISATVPGRVKLTKLSNVTFSNVDPSAAVSNAQNVCVWSNTAGRKYTIKATGSGSSSAFTLTDGVGIVPYSVEWAQTSGATSGLAMTAGATLADQVSSSLTQDCTAGNSASLIVGIASTDLQGMTASTPYTGTLTLLVSPQ
jgi:hypothetical protein